MPEATAQEAIKQSQFKFIPQFNSKNKPIRLSGNLGRGSSGLFKEMARSLVTNGSKHLVLELQRLKEQGEDNPKLWQDRDRALLLVNSYEQAKWVADEIRYCWLSLLKAAAGVSSGGTLSNSQQVDHLFPDTAEKYPDEYVDRVSKPGELNRADIETFGQTGGKILVAPMSAIGRGFNILNAYNKAAFGAVYFLTRPYPHPHDTQAIAQELNRRALEWVEKEDFVAWQQGDGIAQRAELVRKQANRYWRSVEQRSYYKTLRDNSELCAEPRYDLAATTVGRVIQAVGRLIRGGVPFHGYFVDSAWADNSAKRIAAPDFEEIDTEEDSLLVAMILRICDYASEDNSVGNALYKPLAEALENIEGLFY